MSVGLSTALSSKEIVPAADPLATLQALRCEPFPWLLDSAMPEPDLGRFSLVGADPYLVVRARGRRMEIDCRRAVRPDLEVGCRVVEGDALETIRSLMPSLDDIPEVRDLPFVGGVVGYWGYELAEQMDEIELHARDDLGLPDLVLLFVDQLLVFDHRESRAFAIGLGFSEDPSAAQERARERAEALVDRCRGLTPLPSAHEPVGSPLPWDALEASLPAGSLHSFFGEGEYASAVDRIRGEIEKGRVYQSNLTHRMDLASAADPWALYLELRALTPTPFAAYLELDDVAILSSSPERFVRLDAQRAVESRPIKGTRPRGTTAAEDAALEKELQASAKDRAENLMIVDLVRNDLGRVCELGSVKVPALQVVESYATVFQMVSAVTGRLRPDRDVFDLIRAAFPPGSMTGAPKLAAMALIDQIEPVRRGIYSGALGYLDVRGGADLSVVIRTLLVEEGQVHLNVGGGIVADSDPIAEYRETLDKARAMLAAVILRNP